MFGEIAGQRRDFPRTSRPWPHDSAAPRQLPREFVGAEGAGRERHPRGGLRGGIRDALPGDLVLPHQLIDYTSGRAQTFFDGGDQQVVHVDFTHPVFGALRGSCWPAARRGKIALRDGGVYGAVSGPRLETAAEIDRMDRDGATLVGMTGMPEACLARELGIDYASVCVVVNHAAGRGDSAAHVSMERSRTCSKARWTMFAR